MPPSKPVTDGVRHVDLALAERCRTHSPGAFDDLYRTHAPRLFGLACRQILGDPVEPL